MSVDNQGIYDEFERSRDENPNMKFQYLNKVCEQRKEEEKYMNKFSKIPLDNFLKKSEIILSSRIDYINEEIENDFDEPNITKMNSNGFKGMYYHADRSNGNNYESDEVAEWFSDNKIIGNPNHNGLIGISSCNNLNIHSTKTEKYLDNGGSKYIAVIKKIINKDLQTDVVHNVYVSSKGTNTLREINPNFAYVYGGCKFSDANDNKKQYIVYETIPQAKYFRESINEINLQDFFNMYLQVSLATWIAYKNFDWTHYNLHYENVLIREIPHHPTFYIKYEFPDRPLYLKANKVATIIDFEYSHIKIGENHYGHSVPNYGVKPNESFPLFDMYKLLMYLSLEAKTNGRDDLLILMENIFYYFSEENFENAIDYQKDLFYYLPKTLAESNNLNLKGFIEHLLGNFPEYVDEITKRKEPNDNIPVLGLGTGCKNVGDIIKNLNEIDEPKTIFEFYDLNIFDNNIIENKRNEVPFFSALAVENFKNKYHLAIKKHIKQIENDFIKIKEYLNYIDLKNLTLKVVRGFSINKIFNITTLKEFQDYKNTILHLSFLINKIKFYLVVGKQISQIYNKKEKSFFDEKKIELKEITNKYSEIIPNSREIQEYLKEIACKGDGNRKVRENNIFEWYIIN